MWFPRVNSNPPLWSEEISRKMMDLSAPQLAICTLFSTPGLGGIFKNRIAVILLEWSSRVWRKLYSLDTSNKWINRSLEADASKLEEENKKLYKKSLCMYTYKGKQIYNQTANIKCNIHSHWECKRYQLAKNVWQRIIDFN